MQYEQPNQIEDSSTKFVTEDIFSFHQSQNTETLLVFFATVVHKVILTLQSVYFATTPRHQKKTFEESVITLEKDIANLFVDEQKNISQIDTSSYIKYCDELLASTGLKVCSVQ